LLQYIHCIFDLIYIRLKKRLKNSPTISNFKNFISMFGAKC